MFGFTGLSNGIFLPYGTKLPIYIANMKSPIMMEQDWGLLPLICGEGLCQKGTRLLVAKDAFNKTTSNVTEFEGIGMPYDGLQSVGHMKGPSSNGRPM